MPSLIDRLLGRQTAVVPTWEPLRRLDSRWDRTVKAVNGGTALNAWMNDVPISMLNISPQEKAAAYLKAYKVGWFYKAESKISLDIANLKRTLSPEDEQGDNETAILEADLTTPWEGLDPPHQLLRLLEKPNPQQTGRQLLQKTQIRADMAGWTYWYMENAGPIGSGQLPTAIYGISPTRLTPSFDNAGNLLGWVLDANKRGGGQPFEAHEIVVFSQETAEDYPGYGQGIVEAVMAEMPLGNQMAQHQSDLFATGGRLAGMLWPKDRALDEDEFTDAMRAWRSVASDPNAARRLLLFPEPMEYAVGAADPANIGIPALAELNRDNILTAFPISPYQLGVPMPGGLNSAELRREDRRDYWEGTIHPRTELLEEVIQTRIVAMYEAVTGTTYDFDFEEPDLDDAGALIEKAAAVKVLWSLGFDDKASISAAGLDSIPWNGRPAPEPVMPPPVDNSGLTVGMPAIERGRGPATAETLLPQKAAHVVNERDAVTDPAAVRAKARMQRFFSEQRLRVTQKMKASLPALKSERMKASDPTTGWWDSEEEDAALEATMREIYADVGQGALQTVANTLDRSIVKGATQSVIRTLLTKGGQRIVDINANTLQALTVELAEGTRRGYSIAQLIDGVPAEDFRGVLQAGLDNGVAAWSDARAETIARTETARSYNDATVAGYGEFGVTTLLAYDGDQDEECAARDGQEFSIDDAYAEDEAEHPNGTLVWSPVVEKAYKPPSDVALLAESFLKAIESMGTPTPVYITMPPPPDIHLADVNVNTPDVHVNTPDVHVDVHIPETDPPVIHVDGAVVNVPETAITVNVPEQKPPIVKVTSPVNMTMTHDMKITSMPDRITERRVTRDNKGAITNTTEVETDG